MSRGFESRARPDGRVGTGTPGWGGWGSPAALRFCLRSYVGPSISRCKVGTALFCGCKHSAELARAGTKHG